MGRITFLSWIHYNAHTFNFQFMKLMNDNNVVVLSLPPHTTHAMQPLDDIPFANFKNEWYEVVHKFVRKYAAKKIAKYEWFDLFMHAMLEKKQELLGIFRLAFDTLGLGL